MIDRPFVYLAQTNPVACDLEGNAKQILDAAKTAHELGASICVTPAMSLTGWPLEGWLEREDFWMSLEEAINGLAQALYRIVIFIQSISIRCIYFRIRRKNQSLDLRFGKRRDFPTYR